jgi:hypothetical protein
MSIFVDPKNTNLIADIETRANPIGKSVLKPILMVLIGAGGGMFLGGPVVAGAIAAVPAWGLIKTLRSDVEKNQFTRRHPGSIAHLISSEQDMIAWIEAHGAPKVKEQLMLAMQSGQPITATAKRVAAVLIPAEQMPSKDLKSYLPQLTEATGANLPSVSALLGGEQYAGVAVAGAVSQSAALAGSVDVSTGFDRNALIERLKQDCPVMLNLVKSHPIRAVGVQRSGKTTLVKLVALLRILLMENHEVVASTPHYEPANPYPDAFRLVGWDKKTQSRDYASIRKAWQAMQDDVLRGGDRNITYIWDEFGLQDQAIPISNDDDPIKDAVKSCLRETMKFGIYPIFIVHGETAEFLPGSKGLVTVFKSSTARLEAIGEPVTGADGLPTIKPTGRFKFTSLDGLEAAGEIPPWLNEKALLEMIAAKGGGAKLPPEMEAITRMAVAQAVTQSVPQTITVPAISVTPTEPTEDELKQVGGALAKLMKAKATGQSVESPIVGAIAAQSALAKNGQFKEAIQTMIPYVCESPAAFMAMFPNMSHVAVYLGVE